jgi:hypothetical protein
MTMAARLEQNFAPTQLVGSAIEASLYVLPIANGVLHLAAAMGFDHLADTRSSVLGVVAVCWLVLFLPGRGRWPAISRILADPHLSIADKIKATLTNWFSLTVIVATFVWIAGAAVRGVPLLP